MRVKLQCTVRAMSDRAIFPKSTLAKVVVSNCDACNYVVLDCGSGAFDVDFELEGPATDHLKFHFFTGDAVPVFVAGGGIFMGEPAGRYSFESNFQKVRVEMTVRGDAVDTNSLRRSALHRKREMMQDIVDYTDALNESLQHNATVSETNGGSMFSRVLAIHNFESQVSSHLHYEQDFMPTPYTSKRYLETGITMHCLLETLLLQQTTIAAVMNLSDESEEFTRFVSLVCQAPMRSAQVCPYTPDMNVGPLLGRDGKHQLVPGESFKRPFGEPFNKTLHCVQNDDCEGEALLMLQLFWSFGHLVSENYCPNDLFPEALFRLSDYQMNEAYGLAERIGKLVLAKKLMCEVTLVSSGSAALGQEPQQLGGHATCVLVNMVNKPYDILMEGTNCISPELHAQTIELGDETVSLSAVANQVTQRMVGDKKGRADVRAMIHLETHGTMPFYKSAFVQSDKFVATKGEPRPSYGVHVNSISDYNVKVFMPSNDNRTERKIRRYVKERCDEIHPPLAPTTAILEAIKHWAPLTLLEPTCKRPSIPCLYTEAVEDPKQREIELERAQQLCDNWNSEHGEIGHAAAFCAFDSVYHTLYLYTDDLARLKQWIESP